MIKSKIKFFLNKFLLSTTGRDYFYSKRILKNKIRRLLYSKIENKFLFILSPQYCGSTLLNELISTSQNVSVNNTRGTREGQKLPKIKPIMNVRAQWDENLDFDWLYIKKEWMKYWDITLPVLLEKSPPNIVRANSISKVFSPAFFIIFYRNPYAHCQSLINRNKVSALEAAKFAIWCLKHQKNNIENLDNVILLSYEFLTENTTAAIKNLSDVLPELADIKDDRLFYGNNLQGKRMKITNQNENKIALLSDTQIDEINTVFKENIEVLKFFNYNIFQN